MPRSLPWPLWPLQRPSHLLALLHPGVRWAQQALWLPMALHCLDYPVVHSVRATPEVPYLRYLPEVLLARHLPEDRLLLQAQPLLELLVGQATPESLQVQRLRVLLVLHQPQQAQWLR